MEAVAHGGHCVARHEGRVVFVRHALPGERVIAEVSEGAPGDRYWRADAVEVLDASPDRVEPPCPYAGPRRCGGCDWQHAALAAQRLLKGDVVAEQLRRLAGIERSVEVEPVPGDHGGLDWRTRVRYAVDEAGRVGLRRHRSHEVVAVDLCRIAHPAIAEPAVLAGDRVPGRDVSAVVSAGGEVLVDGRSPTGGSYAREVAAGRDWRVSAGGFWQVHPGLADVLVDAVLDMLAPHPGERGLALYSGVGLFAGALADRVGPGGRVVAVESNARAVADARRNLHAVPTVRLVPGRVEQVLPRLGLDSVDVVVLDPPRTGAGRRVVAALAALQPRSLAYVACDPAALARDVAAFSGHGYGLAALRAFDAFPMTHHVECVALLRRAANPASPATQLTRRLS